jgi:hypothetical protein
MAAASEGNMLIRRNSQTSSSATQQTGNLGPEHARCEAYTYPASRSRSLDCRAPRIAPVPQKEALERKAEYKLLHEYAHAYQENPGAQTPVVRSVDLVAAAELNM